MAQACVACVAWSCVLNTTDKRKAKRILKKLEPYVDLELEKFREPPGPPGPAIKAFFYKKLEKRWPASVVEALRAALVVGPSTEVWINPVEPYVGGFIEKPTLVGISWAEWWITDDKEARAT